MLEKIIFEIFKLILIPILSSLLYHKKIKWTKNFSALFFGYLLYKKVSCIYLFRIKDLLLKNGFMNSIYYTIKPLWKGDFLMLINVFYFIIIFSGVYLFLSIILKTNPTMLKKYYLQEELNEMRNSCKTIEEYEIKKDFIQSKYQNLKNIKIDFLFNEETNQATVFYSYKDIEIANFSLFLKDSKEKDYKQLTIHLSEVREAFLKLEIKDIRENIYPYLLYEIHIIPYVMQNKIIINITDKKTKSSEVLVINK